MKIEKKQKIKRGEQKEKRNEKYYVKIMKAADNSKESTRYVLLNKQKKKYLCTKKKNHE